MPLMPFPAGEELTLLTLLPEDLLPPCRPAAGARGATTGRRGVACVCPSGVIASGRAVDIPRWAAVGVAAARAAGAWCLAGVCHRAAHAERRFLPTTQHPPAAVRSWLLSSRHLSWHCACSPRIAASYCSEDLFPLFPSPKVCQPSPACNITVAGGCSRRTQTGASERASVLARVAGWWL